MRGSLVRILALPEWVAVLKETDRLSGQKLSGALMLYDPQSCSLRTAQQSLVEDLTECYQTLPPWGSMRNGAVYQRQQLVRPTDVIGGGVLQDVPTPCGWDATRTGNDRGDLYETNSGTIRRKNSQGTSSNCGLATMAKLWPTATATAAKGSSPASLTRKSGKSREKDRLDHAVMATDGGQLNPTWVEWLMGWPIGSTELKR